MRKQLYTSIAGLTLLLGRCGGEQEFAVQDPPRVLYAEQALTEGGIPNVTPPTELDILMDSRLQTGEELMARCTDWGGELIYYPRWATYHCEGIDY